MFLLGIDGFQVRGDTSRARGFESSGWDLLGGSWVAGHPSSCNAWSQDGPLGPEGPFMQTIAWVPIWIIKAELPVLVGTWM